MKNLMKSVLTCILIILSNITFAQQWNTIPQLIVGLDTVTSVNSMENFGNKMYFSTDKGLFESSDNGDSWSNLTWSNGIAANQGIRNSFVDPITGDIYVSSDSSIYKSIDNGSTWNTTSVNGNLKNINHIYKTGNNIVIAHNYQGGGVIYSTDGLASTQTGIGVNAGMWYFLVDGNTTFVSGVNGVYKSTDNGLNWVISGTGFPTGSRYGKILKSGSSLLISDIWGKGLYESNDNGLTWANANPTEFNGFCQVFDIAMAGGTIIATMDGACGSLGPIKSSSDNGNNWNIFTIGLAPGFFPKLGSNASTNCFFTFSQYDKTFYRYCGLTNSIDESNISKVSVYPNPVQNKINLTVNTENDYSYTILSTLGEVIIPKQKSNKSNIEIDFKDYANGVYIILIDDQKNMYTKKIIKN